MSNFVRSMVSAAAAALGATAVAASGSSVDPAPAFDHTHSLFATVLSGAVEDGHVDYLKHLHKVVKPGKRHLLNLWATWCGPCRVEIPELQRLEPELEHAGIRLIGLSIDSRDSTKADTFLSRLGASYENFVVVGEAARQIYASDDMFVPLSFVIDDKGVVLDIFKGWSANSLEKIKSLAAE